MKLSKAFPRWLKETSPELLEAYEDAREHINIGLSVVIDNVKKGVVPSDVYISLLPEDFLGMSYGNNWSSCCAFNSGMYGHWMSLALDSVTAIAFVASDDPNKVADYMPVPRRLWRMNCFVDAVNGAACFGREYPSERESFASAARASLAHALARWHQVEPNWLVNRSAHPKFSAVGEQPSSSLQHHVHHASRYTYGGDRMTAWIRLKELGNAPQVRIGTDDLVCTSCGEVKETSQWYVCRECRTGEQSNQDRRCYYCDVNYNRDVPAYTDIRALTLENGLVTRPVCEGCYLNFTGSPFYCHVCEVFNSGTIVNLARVLLASDRNDYRDIHVCRRCMELIRMERNDDFGCCEICENIYEINDPDLTDYISPCDHSETYHCDECHEDNRCFEYERERDEEYDEEEVL